MISIKIKINKNTIKSFLRKNKIENVEVFLNYIYDGMIDGTRYVKEKRVISVDDFLKDLSSSDAWYDINDNEIVLFNSSFSYRIIDKRFDKLKEELKRKIIKEEI